MFVSSHNATIKAIDKDGNITNVWRKVSGNVAEIVGHHGKYQTKTVIFYLLSFKGKNVIFLGMIFYRMGEGILHGMFTMHRYRKKVWKHIIPQMLGTMEMPADGMEKMKTGRSKESKKASKETKEREHEMADNNENQAAPVPGPGPDEPINAVDNRLSKQRDLTLEEMEEMNMASDTHAILPKGAERGENVLSPELEITKFIQDGIQGAADFITEGIQSFDGYVTDCAEEVADYDYEFTVSNCFFGLYGASEFEKGYLGRGGSFSIPKAMGCVGRAAVNLAEGMLTFPVQAAGHPVRTVQGMAKMPGEYIERFLDGNWTERVTAGTEIAAMVGLTTESALKLKNNLKNEKAMKEAAQQEAAKNKENGIPDGCFTAGTIILTKEGLKAIEDIRAGEYILAEDMERGIREYKKVIRTTIRKTEKIIHLIIAGEEIETTGNHPFWVTKRGWVPAEELQLYDEVELSDGSHARIENLWQEKTGEETAVYNMEVEDYHTYYIAKTGILVHNDGGCAKANGEVRIRKNESGSNFKGQIYKGARNSEIDFINGKGKSTLTKHAGKHGYAFPEEYLKDARNFLEKQPTSTTQSFVSGEGTYFRYDTVTNEFGIINQYGGISTYFKPEEGMTYWLEQIEKYAQK